jgi:hypothetical protein
LPTFVLSCAQPPPPELIGEERPPCQPPGAPDAVPSIPKRRPKVRNYPRALPARLLFLYGEFALVELCRAYSRARTTSDRFNPAPCPCIGPGYSSPHTGAGTGLGAPDSPSPLSGLLAGVTLTRPEHLLCHSLAPSGVLIAGTTPSSLSPPSPVLANCGDPRPLEATSASAPTASPPRIQRPLLAPLCARSQLLASPCC